MRMFTRSFPIVIFMIVSSWAQASDSRDDDAIHVELQQMREQMAEMKAELEATRAEVKALREELYVKQHKDYILNKLPGENTPNHDQAEASSFTSDDAYHTFALEQITVNRPGVPGGFLRVSMTLEGRHSQFEQLLTENEARVIDAVLPVLPSVEFGTKDKLKSDLKQAINDALPEPVVETIYFSELLIQ